MKDLVRAHKWLLGLHNRSVSFLSLERICWEREIIKMDLKTLPGQCRAPGSANF